MMKSTSTTPNNCWSCGNEQDSAGDMESDYTPSAGDVSICIRCVAPGIFLEDLTVRKPTDEEMEEILKSPRVVAYMLAVRSYLGSDDRNGADL